MKKLIYIVMVLSMAACSSGSVDNPQTDEEILAKISEYKKYK